MPTDVALPGSIELNTFRIEQNYKYFFPTPTIIFIIEMWARKEIGMSKLL